MLSIVLFPDPDGPRRDTNSPGPMAKDTSSTAGTVRSFFRPKLLLSPRTSMRGGGRSDAMASATGRRRVLTSAFMSRTSSARRR